MSLSVGNKIRQMAADGYFGKRDLQAAAENMLDGRGITKSEKRSFVRAFAEIRNDRDVRVTDTALDAYADLAARMRGYSRTQRVFAPTLDKDEIKSILDLHVDRSRSYGGGEYSRGGGSGYRGGEYGGGGGVSGGEF